MILPLREHRVGEFQLYIIEAHVLGGFAAVALGSPSATAQRHYGEPSRLSALTNRKYHSATLLYRLDLYNNVKRLLILLDRSLCRTR